MHRIVAELTERVLARFALGFQQIEIFGDQAGNGFDVLEKRTDNPQAEKVVDSRDALAAVGLVLSAQLVEICLEILDSKLDRRGQSLLFENLSYRLGQLLQCRFVGRQLFLVEGLGPVALRQPALAR